MRLTRTEEMACWLLSAAASNEITLIGVWWTYAFCEDWNVYQVADAAWRAVPVGLDMQWDQRCAEAECLIRTGQMRGGR